ncbi:DUF2339 domain-containing protein [Qipengyuania sp. YG27]|uniref:DUF2339 domain-containing protein n=1 Tax=Qipengyuania mesophila TaxID=2867246 RepID=A0ABS7JX56_9SPHN|nr:DUF2339 domain-containing protein [Qipengyuania mesophila]MBX7502240.1 DUF2339 domain-containing protein [Qipengyuania mesophila]
MEWIVILALGAVVVHLWRRLDSAETRLGSLDAVQDRMYDLLLDLQRRGVEAAPEAEPEEVAEVQPPPPPAPQSISIPTVRLIREEAEPVALGEEPEPQREPESAEEPAIVADEPEPALASRFSFDLEDIFGRRLPIWAGGVTLAVAGVFLVRYSIESGLLTPLVRVIMAFFFGFALLAGAEAAFRFRERVADPRVTQALAGAGLATLYAGFYLAGTQYGLVGQTVAFLGLAAVTAGAIALSFRFGLPSAVLGLVGGFAAPALVGGEEANLPLLSLYLGLVTAGLTVSGRSQSRPWMGIAALVGGLGWGALLLLSGDPGVAEILALGLYFVVLGAVLPALTGAERWERPLRLASAFVASVQLALLVDQGGYAPLAWALHILLGATLAFFGWRNSVMREANAIAAVVGVLLLAQWDDAAGGMFASVAVGLAAVFALVPLAHIWRGEDRPIDLWQACGVALGIGAVTYGTFGSFDVDLSEPLLALASAALALVPGVAAWRKWRSDALDLTIALASAATLVFAALLMVTPAWTAPAMAAAVFAGLFVLLRGRGEKHLATVLWAAAFATLLALPFTDRFYGEIEHLSGWSPESLGFTGLLRWLAVTLPFAALAWRVTSNDTARRGAEALAAFFAYGTLAQVLPEQALAWSAALLALAIYYLQRPRIAAQVVALAISALWAIEPLGLWLEAGVTSLAGDPVYLSDLPVPAVVGLRLLPITAALFALRWPPIEGLPRPMRLHWLALPMMLVIAHITFKEVFAIETQTRFVAMGLAERTLWQALLVGLAWIAATGVAKLGASRTLAIGLAALSFVHFALYTGLLHDPLWDRQALGPLPIANLALAAYAIAVAAALSLRLWLGERARLVADAVVMALVSIGALTLLRQVFAGSIAVEAPMTQTEDLLRSLLGIVLALFFLFLGSRLQERSWRVGSLVLMLIAVAKVFIVDAAGLEGLLRIASFMALGFSLIGIGWVYSRQLRAKPAAVSNS